MTRGLFLFATTDDALWAEEVAGEVSIPAELVPTPPGHEALCDLALETFPDRMDELERALDSAGVQSQRWSPLGTTPTGSPSGPVRAPRRSR